MMAKKVVKLTREDGVTQGYHVGSDAEPPEALPDRPDLARDEDDLTPEEIQAAHKEKLNKQYAQLKAHETPEVLRDPMYRHKVNEAHRQIADQASSMRQAIKELHHPDAEGMWRESELKHYRRSQTIMESTQLALIRTGELEPRIARDIIGNAKDRIRLLSAELSTQAEHTEMRAEIVADLDAEQDRIDRAQVALVVVGAEPASTLRDTASEAKSRMGYYAGSDPVKWRRAQTRYENATLGLVEAGDAAPDVARKISDDATTQWAKWEKIANSPESTTEQKTRARSEMAAEDERKERVVATLVQSGHASDYTGEVAAREISRQWNELHETGNYYAEWHGMHIRSERMKLARLVRSGRVTDTDRQNKAGVPDCANPGPDCPIHNGACD